MNTNISYQIIINAYLREVEHRWQLAERKDYPELAQQWPDAQRLICIRLPEQHTDIIVPVTYWSLTLRHQFAFPIVCRAIGHKQWQTLELSHFVTLTMREEGIDNQRGSGELDTLLLRCLASQQNTERFIKHRQNDIEYLNSGQALSFIDSEQSLLIGHQLHPVAKSREGFSSTDLLRYSPETAGRFQLHYFAAHQDIVHQDSSLEQSAADTIKQQLRSELSQDDQARITQFLESEEYALIPIHPWQAEYLRQSEKVKALEETGRLHYLGSIGAGFTATTSIRTVFYEHSDFMYKLSLNVRITNSERVNKSWELDRVVETARMMQLPIAKDIQATAPDFHIVQEPAYISIKVDGEVLDGFSCIFRDAKPFIDANRDITSITSLVQDNPNGTANRLANIIHALATKENRSVSDVARDWFSRYVTVSIESLMKLFIDWGLCFEPHGQNTLIELEDGYPARCFCRDGQGFFHRQASHKDWCKLMPSKGEATESIFPEALACERLIYYPFINQVFSVINAFGTQGLIDEALLMGDLRQRMNALAQQPQRYPFTLLDVLTKEQRLPCKGNLLTQLYDMDELVGDIETQSVYVTVPNSYLDIAEADAA